MSVFDCNKKFKKVDGDSYISTYNKLVSQGFIDKFNNIKDVGKFYKANTELSDLASAILGFDVRLYETPMRPKGRVAVANRKAFGMIDQTIKEKNQIAPEIQINNEANEFIVNGEVLPTFEDAQNNLINEQISRISDSIRGELLQDSRRRNNNRNGFIARGEESLPKTSTDTQDSLSRNNEEKKEGYFLENVEFLMSSIRQRLSDKTSLIGRLFTNFEESLGSSLVIQNEGHFIYSQDNKLYINQQDLLSHLKNNIDNPDEYLDVLLFEELIHILTFDLTKNESIRRIARDQFNLDRKLIKKVDGVYATTEELEAYLEYIRIMVQESILGKTTLGARNNWTKDVLKFIEKLLKKIRNIVQTPRTRELIDQHIEYINKIYPVQVPIIEKIYEIIDQKVDTLVSLSKLKVVQKEIDEYNKLENKKILSLKETKIKNKFTIKTEYNSGYMFNNILEIPKEEKITYMPREDESDFTKPCITG